MNTTTLRIAILVATLSACGAEMSTDPTPVEAPTVISAETPRTLSATGLYTDINTFTLNPRVMEFTPRFRLFSDGAEKTRWILLPPGARIDTSDMDHWSFPVGTRLWKEFRVHGVRVETRMVERVGPGPDDFRYAAYRWDDAEHDAVYAPDGATNARGTGHDIPSSSQCLECHGRLPEHVLGFGAIQLSHHDRGVTIASLSASGLLTVPHAQGYAVPGDDATQAAIGYLHANCSHCHNAAGVQFANPFSMRLLVGQTTLAETSVYRTAVGVPTVEFRSGGVTHRVAPGDVAASCVAHRMAQRNNDEQMPPLGTHEVDQEGLAVVTAWIASLQPPLL